MNKQIFRATLLTLFLQPIALLCTDEPGTQISSYTIPLINIPISFEQKDGELTNLEILDIVFLHGFLVCLQKNDNSLTLQTMIGQHALLWATKHILGFLNVLGHELGHAIVWKQSGNCQTDPKIVIKYSAATLFTGMYSGVTRATVYTDFTIAKERKILLSNNRQETDPNNIITTDKESYLEWAHKVQKKCFQDIAATLAGPAAGITTTSILMYALSYIQPTLWSQKIDNLNLAILLVSTPMVQNILSLLPSYNEDTKIWSDGAQTWDAWQRIQEIEKITEQVRALPDGSEITLYFFDK